MRRATTFALAAALAGVGSVIACGDVPTLQDGIAYITFTLPAPAVGVRDVLRDSLGRPAPLLVRGFDRSGAEIPVSGVTWLSTPVPVGNGVTIDANGLVTAGDTIATVQIVGRVGDRLQTTPVALSVVPQPDSIAATNAADTSVTRTLPALDTMRVTVTGAYTGARTRVQKVLVRYRIEGIYPASAGSGYAVLTNRSGAIPRPDSTTVVDTTDTNGASTSTLVVGGSGVDSVVVRVRAARFDGQPLGGSPVRFVLKRKP